MQKFKLSMHKSMHNDGVNKESYLHVFILLDDQAAWN